MRGYVIPPRDLEKQIIPALSKFVADPEKTIFSIRNIDRELCLSVIGWSEISIKHRKRLIFPALQKIDQTLYRGTYNDGVSPSHLIYRRAG